MSRINCVRVNDLSWLGSKELAVRLNDAALPVVIAVPSFWSWMR
jgi:hypothetical protein